MIFISCVFKTTVHRYNISSSKKEQLKLHRRGEEGITPSLQHLAITVKINILGQILVKSATNSTNNLILHPTYNKYIVNFFSKTLGVRAENNLLRSSISD